MELATDIYRVTEGFPKHELYGLVSQIRRAAVSIPSNIAEGAGRNSDKEFIHFLSVANGSAFELQTQLIISNNLNLLSAEITAPLLEKLDDIQKKNYRLQESLRVRINSKSV